MDTSKHREITFPETECPNLSIDTTCEGTYATHESTDATSESTGTTCESTSTTRGKTDTTCESKDTTCGSTDKAGESKLRNKETTTSVDTTCDTLTLARLDRESQGPWEFEYSYGGEGDLHRHYDSCKKNPGHKNFIPVDKFSVEDLPEDYRDKNVVDYIRAVSDLTVRVTVNYVSDKRPATAPGSQKPYPYYNVRGQRKMTAGTGWVSGVLISRNALRGLCQCKDCLNSSTPEENYAIISIDTAAHVVFDDLEGEHTICDLFFDRGDNPYTNSSVVALTGVSGVQTRVVEDFCYMEHYTHDMDLAQRLQEIMYHNFQEKGHFYCEMLSLFKVTQRRDILLKPTLLFLVSHPHGCSKKVSLGRATRVNVFNDRIVSVLYNTASCPGSSGAHVGMLQMDEDVKGISEYKPERRVHRGFYDVRRGINFCYENTGFRTPRFVSLEMLQLNTGQWEDNFCCVEEKDQNKHYAACKKNPGHGNFFPADKFSRDHLPPFYQRDGIVEFLRMTSDLTVRVTVKCVSEKRPATIPGTDIPYPWSSNRGSHLTRVGAGWLHYAGVDDEIECECTECRNSPRPKPQLACVIINAAAHLIFDDLEAIHTTCQLSFDWWETPVGSNVVKLTDVYQFFSKIEADTCKIKYFTHDLGLVRSIKSLCDKHYTAFNILGRCNMEPLKHVKQSDGDDATQKVSLHVAIYHPHGCAKQVSIGYCDLTHNANTEESQCSHTSILCPGASGALVNEMSWKVYPVGK